MNIKSIIFRVLIAILLVLFGSLISYKSSKIKSTIYNNIYTNSISFSKIKKLYNNYVGTVIPFQDILDEDVFNEKIRYKDLNIYNKGIKLSLDNDYSIPIIKGGIVIYIGNKEDLNKTVIIEDEDGIDYIYGNLDKVNVKIYDYVKDNNLLGTASNNTLYLLFQKGDEYLDYKKFLY